MHFFLVLIGLFLLWFFGTRFSYIVEWDIFLYKGCNIEMLIYFDKYRISFCILVSFISGIIFKYGEYYCASDNNLARFFFLLFCFVLRIFLLILRPNFIRILIGWDGLGLTSYLLVIYYFTNIALIRGLATIIINRVGDAFLILLIGLIININGLDIIYSGGHIGDLYLFIIVICSITKRAQIPYVSWLPAAMAAPTPVSALVHSSTLVTAGIYIILRRDLRVIFYNSFIMYILLLVRLGTSFIAAFAANIIIDFKKIAAISTIRQLGLIIVSLSLGLNNFCFCHLLRHAMFKSAIFIWVGFIIVERVHRQDFRLYNYGIYRSPFILIILGVSHLRLCGFPFLSSFFTKDKLLEMACDLFLRNFIFYILIVLTGITLSYSYRIFIGCVGKSSKLFFRENSIKDFSVILGFLGFFFNFFSMVAGFILVWWIIEYISYIFIISVLEKYILVFYLFIFLFIGVFLGKGLSFLKRIDYMYIRFLWFREYLRCFFFEQLYRLYDIRFVRDKGWLDIIPGWFFNLRSSILNIIYTFVRIGFIKGYFYYGVLVIYIII